MLNISPFSYGLIVEMVYDSGTVFEPKILDIRPEDLRVKFMEVSDLRVLLLYKSNEKYKVLLAWDVFYDASSTLWNHTRKYVFVNIQTTKTLVTNIYIHMKNVNVEKN